MWTHFGEIISDIGDGAIVVIDAGQVDVAVPCLDPLGVVLVQQYLVDDSSEQNFGTFSGLFHNCLLVLLVADFISTC